MGILERMKKVWGKRILFVLDLCLIVILAWVFFVSGACAAVSNFSQYTQYNNLAEEDTKTGSTSNILNGTYTVPALTVTKYSINRRLYPTGGTWSDTTIIYAVGNDTIEYKVIWIQAGEGAPADTIFLTDAIPSGVTFLDSQIVSGSGAISYDSPVLTWWKNDVSVGETGVLQYRVKVSP